MEERCTAAEKMYEEAKSILSEFDTTQKKGA